MAEVKKTDIWKVPYENLIVKFNLREDYGDIEGLAESILENGVKVPMSGYREPGTDKFIIKDGHRRHRAIGTIIGKLPQPFYIPFVLESKNYSEEQRLVDMFIMNDGKDLTPLEKAEGVRRLINYGFSEREIATKIGKSQSYVNKLVSLSNAPKKLLNLIQKGEIAASTVMDLLSTKTADQFLEDYENGNYKPQQIGEELFENKKPVVKITKGDMQPVNSWKGFKTFAKTADQTRMHNGKAEFFNFLCRVMNNEVTEDDLKSFFQ